ncbi:unnamed protein product [Symbiodinium sp. CCMP2592]|nr:unnamed protein product [Symbiodinium sp. CCMP2592]
MSLGGRNGPRRANEDLDYEQLEGNIDEGSFWQGPLIVAWGAEETYATSSRTGVVRQKGHSVMPAFLKKRWYELMGTQTSIDVRGMWPNDKEAARVAGNPLCVYAAWRAAFEQQEFIPAFLVCYNLLQALVPLEGRSVLQIICSLDASRDIP